MITEWRTIRPPRKVRHLSDVHQILQYYDAPLYPHKWWDIRIQWRYLWTKLWRTKFGFWLSMTVHVPMTDNDTYKLLHNTFKKEPQQTIGTAPTLRCTCHGRKFGISEHLIMTSLKVSCDRFGRLWDNRKHSAHFYEWKITFVPLVSWIFMINIKFSMAAY